MRIIVNADDCGYSQSINERIGNAITRGRITSTTVMANMSDLDGAARLYKEFSEKISFGFHLNLTEGQPLLNNQQLLDLGFYVEKDGSVFFNGSAYRRKFLSKGAREGIYKEVLAQAEKIKDSGIDLSHIDSHHFIHQAFFMIPILPKLCNQLHIYKVRNYWNYYPSFIHRALKSCWSKSLLIQNKRIVFPKWFSSYEMFYDYNERHNPISHENDIVELMVHPGNPIYTREEDLLLGIDIKNKYRSILINYKQIQ